MKAVRARCAVVGCKHEARSKGFCANHYQQMRLLKRTKRLPGAWKAEHPAPQSLNPVVLKRGLVLKSNGAEHHVELPIGPRFKIGPANTPAETLHATIKAGEHLRRVIESAQGPEDIEEVTARAEDAMRSLFPSGVAPAQYAEVLGLYRHMVKVSRA